MREKKTQEEPAEPGRFIHYDKANCLLCEKVYSKSIYLRLREKDILLCFDCGKDLQKALSPL